MNVPSNNSIARQSDPLNRLPLHVVVVTNFIPPHKLPIWRELASRVDRLTVLLSTEMEANRCWQKEWSDLNVQLQRTSTIASSWNHALGFSDAGFVHIPWDTISQLHRLKPDVVISGELGVRSLFCAIHRSLRGRIPLLYWCGLSEHTEKGRGLLRHFLRKGILRRADCILVNGTSGARYLQHMGVPGAHIRRLHYPTLPGVFAHGTDSRPDTTAHHLLFVGQLIERKGLLPFIHALSDWCTTHRTRHVSLTLIGSGPLHDALRQMHVPSNLSLSIRGQCNYSTIIHEMRNAGIFAFPTLADDWGMAVNEAMASGLPVLGSTYSQAVAELCDYGVTGWSFRSDVPSEVDRAIDDALSSSASHLNTMRCRVRERIRDFTPERTVNQIMEAIGSVVRRNPASPLRRDVA